MSSSLTRRGKKRNNETISRIDSTFWDPSYTKYDTKNILLAGNGRGCEEMHIELPTLSNIQPEARTTSIADRS